MSQLLSEVEVQQKLNQIQGWSLQGKTIQSVRTFANFTEAIDFVNRLVEPAESAGHHPDLAISYNKVTVSLSTHDAGGLTDKDFQLASIISKL
ncbi:4a-hydroxytetrahydrobiopterin dehydratase [Leptolyngbya sp. AN02str]|uniref:4a-hydroxytetrahydrobiopterin dehydratase n=1 Tax=Leptolyngbya sp. AN02str TaxID=3423363 RepID=UPI003D3208C1